MYKKWKSVAALGMAVLIGCMMPVDTMIVAAEENPEVGQKIEVDSDNDIGSDGGVILDGEDSGDEENVDDGIVDDENVSDETDADEDENPSDEVNEDGENAADEINADEDGYADDEMDIGNYGIALMSEAGGIEDPVSNAKPEIEIKWNGNSYKYDLGGTVEFKYVNKVDQAFECSASQAASLSYCLEQVYSNREAKGIGDMDKMEWLPELPSFSGYNAHYVLYVKAEANGLITYARSGGIVVDTQSPEVTGVKDGETYPEGTLFKVKDNIDLESVTVNGIPATPASDESYQVSANGTSCVIKAKDKAGNETTCSINVSRNLADNVIRESGIYSLKEGTPYQLAAGKWQVGGDKSVYSGDSTFYVKTSGDYTFTKR